MLIQCARLIPTVPMQGYVCEDAFRKLQTAANLTVQITLNLVTIGFGTFETNLLVIPAFVLWIMSLMVSQNDAYAHSSIHMGVVEHWAPPS